MDDSKWERLGALGGLVFVVLDGAVAVLGGEPPASGGSVSEISAYFSEHQAALEAGLWLFGLASVALIWWFGSLWKRMVRAEGGAPRLAVVSLVGFILAGALSLTSSAVWAATAVRIEDVGESAPFLYTLGSVLLAASGFGVATHLLATNVLGARTRTLPSWLVIGGLLSAAAFLVSAVLGATDQGDASNLIGFAGFVLWCAWILGVSHRIWTEDGPSTVAPAA